jgi:hypothetical protein
MEFLKKFSKFSKKKCNKIPAPTHIKDRTQEKCARTHKSRREI